MQTRVPALALNSLMARQVVSFIPETVAYNLYSDIDISYPYAGFSSQPDQSSGAGGFRWAKGGIQFIHSDEIVLASEGLITARKI